MTVHPLSQSPHIEVPGLAYYSAHAVGFAATSRLRPKPAPYPMTKTANDRAAEALATMYGYYTAD